MQRTLHRERYTISFHSLFSNRRLRLGSNHSLAHTLSSTREPSRLLLPSLPPPSLLLVVYQYSCIYNTSPSQPPPHLSISPCIPDLSDPYKSITTITILHILKKKNEDEEDRRSRRIKPIIIITPTISSTPPPPLHLPPSRHSMHSLTNQDPPNPFLPKKPLTYLYPSVALK